MKTLALSLALFLIAIPVLADPPHYSLDPDDIAITGGSAIFDSLSIKDTDASQPFHEKAAELKAAAAIAKEAYECTSQGTEPVERPVTYGHLLCAPMSVCAVYPSR